MNQTIANDSAALASLFLTSSCIKLPKVGPKILERLEHMHIYTLNDLLWHLPRSFEDRRHITPVSQLPQYVGKNCQVDLEILNVRQIPGKSSRLSVECIDAHETQSQRITLVFFKPQRHQIIQWQKNKNVRVYGEIGQYSAQGMPQLQIVHPESQFYTDQPPAITHELTPIYPSTQGIYQKQWRLWIQWTFEQLDKAPFSIDFLQDLQEASSENNHSQNLLSALKAVHYGQHLKTNAQDEVIVDRENPAYQRLILTELVIHQLLWSPRNAQTQSIAFSKQQHVEQKMLEQIPFDLTNAQQRVLEEIYQDLSTTNSMLRLLQGDVGSGKTLVAALAAAQVAAQGYQVAILAPTEILASQHLQAFQEFLAPLNLEIQLLTGRLKVKARRAILENIASGSTNIIIGTHALFQKDVIYKNLQFIIIDEQHRFGVLQRLALLEKGLDANTKTVPHQLMMTATPIPRTLTMSVYAHMQTSKIDELPPQRKAVVTRAIGDDQREHLYQRVKAFLETGQQVFWVCTLIQETENSGERKSIEEIYDSLQGAFTSTPIGLLHGQLTEEEKSQRLEDFIQKKTLILLATSMVEVGVNIPNANLMVVEDAHNWGLTQLHQLRGRVGRGDKEGFMILIHKVPLQPSGYQRLNILRETNDGFEIADKDLEIRGPGHIIGTAQSGHPDFMVVDLMQDQQQFHKAKELSERLQKEYPKVAQQVIELYSKANSIYKDSAQYLNKA